MSAFLGPIHHWVFNKIKFQNEVTARLIDFAREKDLDMAATLAQKYGELEELPLEEIIDASNIHGWLQQRVSRVEYRLAAAVKALLEQELSNVDELRQLFFDIGNDMQPAAPASAPDAYKLLNDLLLDGMPCDRVNELVYEDDTHVAWRKNTCVHRPYWEETGIGVEIYYALRESLVAGLLAGSDFEFAAQGEECSLKRR